MKTILTESNALNAMKTAAELYCHMYPMNALQLEFKLNVVRDGRCVPTIRMALTDNVKVIDGIIVDATDGNDATHRIVRIKGTNRKENNEFEIEGMNLLTDQIEVIKLP